MLNTFSEIPVFAVLTNMDKCTLSKNEVEEMKTQICKSINIAADKLLLCSNYQSNQRPTPEIGVFGQGTNQSITLLLNFLMF